METAMLLELLIISSHKSSPPPINLSSGAQFKPYTQFHADSK